MSQERSTTPGPTPRPPTGTGPAGAPVPARAPQPADPSSGAAGPRAVLVGPPGSGKSTVARALAHALGVADRDTDSDIERLAGKPISDIFVDDGEPHFRDLERQAVATALREHDGVLALGGGAVMDATVEQALADYTAQGGTVVFLDVSLAQAAPRVGFNTSRPLLLGNPRARWQELMQQRRPVYSRVSTLHVLTDDLRPAQVADQIVAQLGARQPQETDQTSPERPLPSQESTESHDA